MNILNGKIIELLNEGEIVIVKISIKEQIFKVLMLDLHSLQDLKIGTKIQVLFKEHELGFALPHSILSVENSFLARIKSIKKGKILYHIFFDFKGDEISSIITKEKALELKLEEGQEWLCFVKENDIILKAVYG
ncbi:TPA: molybdenum-pterin-binding protein [Campylobacter coli]|uniref:TOBE domain-containing protein n=1 Tax=Campylobacter coli TaxID=195 RepID=UPI00094C9A03|nr:TOBE domain-containing protein [Campylobacter coli]EAI3388297.1 molybdenum-pterin-binding protein [Campylobacter jejuni]EAL1122257.1 molybdenum-pterin-binding protein [Campylobacter coli]EGK8182432.1 molybdenum-pterin-binding protein [Campylobacter coli]EKJ5634538.1 molybdenum-pterin-binding protein [Campylobacter coli]EKJ5774426.1 molybdenum-pterin-binding protein [Campylobacter coli]